MAKRSVLTHTKFKKLCRKLELPEYAGLGVLEALWHLTAREAYRGNIGKLSNEDIAVAIDWREDPDQLVAVLVECRWLDEDPEFRLVVHDWKDHADDATKKAISRNGETFCGQTPSMSGHVATNPEVSRLPEPEPEPSQSLEENSPSGEEKKLASPPKCDKRPDCLATAEAFFLEHGSTKPEAQKFWNFYESKGWKVGKTPMERWRAAASNWISRTPTNGVATQLSREERRRLTS